MLLFFPRDWLSLDLSTLSKVFLNSFLVFLGIGFYAPYIEETLHKLGFSDTFIGLSISLELLGFTLGALFLNRILQKAPHRVVYLSALLGMICMLGALPFIVHAILQGYIFSHILLIIRFLMGLSASYVYVLNDSIVSHFASYTSRKTTLMGVYFTVSSIGFIIGAMSVDILDLCDITTMAVPVFSLLILIGCCFLIFSPQFPYLFESFTKKDTLFRSFKIFLTLPLLIFIAIGYALGGKVTRDLLDIYAAQSNLAVIDATYLLAILIAGSLFLPPILGRISDKIKLHKSLILYCTFLSLFFGFLYFNNAFTTITWPVFFLIGGLYAIFDGLGLTYASTRLTSTLIVSGCMAVEVLESLAGAFLSPFIGDSMAYLGAKGFTGGIFILYFILFLIFIFFYKKAASSELKSVV